MDRLINQTGFAISSTQAMKSSSSALISIAALACREALLS
jgi:hypothetical protein